MVCIPTPLFRKGGPPCAPGSDASAWLTDLVPVGLVVGLVAQVSRLLADVVRSLASSLGVGRQRVVAREPVRCGQTLGARVHVRRHDR